MLTVHHECLLKIFTGKKRERDDPSQTNSSLEFWIFNLRLGFGVFDLGLGTSFGDD